MYYSRLYLGHMQSPTFSVYFNDSLVQLHKGKEVERQNKNDNIIQSYGKNYAEYQQRKRMSQELKAPVSLLPSLSISLRRVRDLAQ